MKSLFRIGLGALALLAIGLLGSNASRAAATETYNAFDPGLGFDAQMEAQAGNCMTECQLAFSAVPAGKKLVVTHVSCQISAAPASVLLVELLANDKTGVPPPYFLEPINKGIDSASNQTIYLVNMELIQTFVASKAPQVTLYGTSDGAINVTLARCSLFGYYT